MPSLKLSKDSKEGRLWNVNKHNRSSVATGGFSLNIP